jgi:polysaccharide biosynthesis transport protein
LSSASAPTGSWEPDPEQQTHILAYLHVIVLRKWIVLAVFVAVAGFATVRSLLTRPVFMAAAQVLIDPENPNIANVQDLTDPAKGRDDYYQTQYSLLRSRALARRAVEQLNLFQDPEFGGPRDPADVETAKTAQPGASPLMEGMIGAFLGRTIISPIKNSRLVSIGFESFRPELAADGANTLAKLYIQQTVEFRFRTSSEAGQWIDDQIEAQRKKATEGDAAIEKIKARDGIINIEERRSLLSQELNQYGSSLNQARTTRMEKEALYGQMRGSGSPEDLPEVQRSPVVQSLRTDLANLEKQKSMLLEKYLDKHPEVVRVQSQIDESRRRIAAEAQALIRTASADYRSAAAQEARLNQALEATKAEIIELNQRSFEYDTKKREIEASKQVLANLLDRSKQTDLAQQMKTSNIRIVDQAVVPSGPIRPNRYRDVMFGVLMGLVCGIGLAFLLEYLDNTIKTPEDVKTHLGAPLLGVVAESSSPSTLVVRVGDQGIFSEGYRVVRTALSYSWAEPAPRCILVTSTAPGEGKTLSSVNLAYTLASLDARVLLIDCDMRKPQSHSLFKARRSPGLSDILVGKVKPSDAIQRLTSLSFLGAGTHVPSPADLMTTHAMKTFLDALRGHFDWIILDSPPVGAVSDALVLSMLTDGVIVVVGAEMVPRGAVKHTLERISDTGARVLGVILNRAQVQKHSYYYGRYYGHYYGHYYGRYGPDLPPRPPRREAAGRVANIAERRAGKGRETG